MVRALPNLLASWTTGLDRVPPLAPGAALPLRTARAIEAAAEMHARRIVAALFAMSGARPGCQRVKPRLGRGQHPSVCDDYPVLREILADTRAQCARIYWKSPRDLACRRFADCLRASLANGSSLVGVAQKPEQLFDVGIAAQPEAGQRPGSENSWCR